MPQANAIVSDRKVAALRQAMGPVIAQALSDRMVVEVMVNPDGKIWIDKIGEGRSYTGQNLAHDDADRILRLLADHAGEVVTRDRPRISATLPVTGERFQGAFMPIVASPAFAIRKRPEVIFSLADYVDRGIMTAAMAKVLRHAAQESPEPVDRRGHRLGQDHFGQRHFSGARLLGGPSRLDRGHRGDAVRRARPD